MPYCCCCCRCTSPRCALCIFTQSVGAKISHTPLRRRCIYKYACRECLKASWGGGGGSGDREQSDRGWHLPGGDTKGETRILFVEFIVFFFLRYTSAPSAYGSPQIFAGLDPRPREGPSVAYTDL